MSVDTRAKAAAGAARESTRAVGVPNATSVVRRFSRRRRRRTVIIGLALALVAGVGIVFPIVLSSGGSDRLRVSTSTNPIGSPSSGGGRFVPPSRVEGNTVIVPITTPEGTRLELRYPRGLAIAESGFATGALVDYCGAASPARCTSATPSSYTISYTTVAAVYGAAPPLTTYRDLDGQTVGYYQAPNPGGRPSGALGAPDTTLNAVAVQLGPWLLQLPDRPASQPGSPPQGSATQAALALSNTLRATTVASIGGHVDTNGYLVLELTRPPLSFTPLRTLKGFIAFGGTEAASNQLAVSGQQYCSGPGADTTRIRRFHSPGSQAAAAWCDPRSHLHLDVIGTRRFVDAASGAITLRILEPPRPAALECPSARQPRTGSPDGLPMLGQTAQPRVEAIVKTQGARIRRRFRGIVRLTVEPRNGQVWQRQSSGVISTRDVPDYWIVAQLHRMTDCPARPSDWNGVPLRFVVE
jgi:hypothetical protein